MHPDFQALLVLRLFGDIITLFYNDSPVGWSGVATVNACIQYREGWQSWVQFSSWERALTHPVNNCLKWMSILCLDENKFSLKKISLFQLACSNIILYVRGLCE